MKLKVGDKVKPKEDTWYEEGRGKIAIVKSVSTTTNETVFVEFEKKMRLYQQCYYYEYMLELVGIRELI